MQTATAAARRLGGRVGRALLSPIFQGVQARYGLRSLEATERGGTWWFTAVVNPQMIEDSGIPAAASVTGASAADRFNVNDGIKARQGARKWVAFVTQKTNQNISWRYADTSKGLRTVTITLFDSLVAAGDIEPYIADRRGTFVGANPPRTGPVGDAIRARYERQGLYQVFNRPPPSPQVRYRPVPSGEWVNISDCDLSHDPIDAVTFWNTEGYKFGPRSPQVRAFMMNPDNYIFEPSSINRARGSRGGETYRDPLFVE
jgi:hypothetical protein